MGARPGDSTAQLSNGHVLAQLDDDFAVVRVLIENVREQDRNARIMPANMQKSLAANIARDGHLESLPLAHLLASGEWEIISGHHRLRAAREAGLGEVALLAYLKELPRNTVRSKQLAHNAHEGFDDPGVLRDLYLEIDDADARLSTFLDPEKLNLQAVEQPLRIEDVRIPFEWHYVSFAFLPYQRDAFDLLCERMKADEDTLCLMPEEIGRAHV
jgi:hypothetical protein